MKVNILNCGHRLTEAKIKQAEKKMNRSIPSPYRTFLLSYNGGHPEPCDFRIPANNQLASVEWFFGIEVEPTINLVQANSTYRNRLPEDLFPVARVGGGNLICIATSMKNVGKVYFWDHEEEADEGESPTYDNVYLVSSSFERFLANLE